MARHCRSTGGRLPQILPRASHDQLEARPAEPIGGTPNDSLKWAYYEASRAPLGHRPIDIPRDPALRHEHTGDSAATAAESPALRDARAKSDQTRKRHPNRHSQSRGQDDGFLLGKESANGWRQP